MTQPDAAPAGTAVIRDTFPLRRGLAFVVIARDPGAERRFAKGDPVRFERPEPPGEPGPPPF